MKHYTLTLKNRQMELGERTCIMGILNITPNSFSDGGRFFDTETALAHAEQMARSGADIIDIGGESTRPFSDPVSPEEEIKRVVPVTRQAIAAGAAVINDISGLRLDPEIAEVAAQYGAPLILMHMKGTPKTMQAHPHYDDLIGEIGEFLENAIAKARAAGVPQNRIIADPGIGFGKTLSHNLCLINRLNAFERLDVPILVGSSRKSFIRSLLRKNDQPDIDPAHPRVETGTQATVAAAILRGAHIVRVHDVENTVVTARIIDAIRNVSDNP